MYAIMGFTVTSFTEVLITIILSFLINISSVLIFLQFTQVFALWAETDWDYGGLALSSTTVGLIQAAAGPLLVRKSISIKNKIWSSKKTLTIQTYMCFTTDSISAVPLCPNGKIFRTIDYIATCSFGYGTISCVPYL